MANEKARYSYNITYNNVKGMVLYPDDYNQDPVSGTVTTLPDGVVFLPAAGYRKDSDLKSVGDNGHCWSSSASAAGSDGAYYVQFNNSTVNDGAYGYRYYGFSVRLVIDAN